MTSLTRSILLFAICQGILLYCAGWTVYQAVPHTTAGWEDITALFQNRTFLDLAISLLATYGLYLISSILYFEPWHMITSFAQYLLLLPSYVNILLIYAFCNLHDVSWGTKGDNGAAKDLGSAKKVEKDGKEMAEVAVPTKQEDVEALWQQARQELRVPTKEVHEKRSPETKRNDEDRNFRTNVVLLFLGCNMLIILLFTSSAFTNWISSHWTVATETTFNPYLVSSFGLTGIDLRVDCNLLCGARALSAKVCRMCVVPRIQAVWVLIISALVAMDDIYDGAPVGIHNTAVQ